MKFRIEVICVGENETEQRREVRTVAKDQVSMETLGLTRAEGKARISLENSGFSRLCRKAMEWLSDDTTHFHYSL